MSVFKQLIDPLDPGWEQALAPAEADFAAVAEQLKERRRRGEQILPEPANILRAFRQPFEEVKVLVLGQDPYPTPGHPIGMSFAVAADVRPLPKSLVNIFKELQEDLGIEPSPHGDLTAWAEQGVLMLNRALTVTAGAPASHRGIGWEAVTGQAVRALVERGTPLVSILWGGQARQLQPVLSAGERTAVITSPHPSPLSAYRGFFGSRPFSRTNEALLSLGAEPVDWQLPPAGA
ncbi:uracil-DNA glycosylase [Nesterenkonia alkaliphila]|uniref:Uracil-DNA glycosylase n=1 Tax=Nesterenkonia alkaliphila TaxID=1463631 RepID=A0A7K1UFS0_9MICC|nr:uracil-DNA glycosylase [Nesterenkonia alkaliphila]MVT25234.1 uracil-DNA glycosylase [Nesterenkonia alkaliphila]GFZ95029.1 uracil-DNA glycosylase [Nesterenkonia alkaliphila]